MCRYLTFMCLFLAACAGRDGQDQEPADARGSGAGGVAGGSGGGPDAGEKSGGSAGDAGTGGARVEPADAASAPDAVVIMDRPLDEVWKTKATVMARLPGLAEGPSYRPSDGSVFTCARNLIRVADGKRYRVAALDCLGTVVLADESLLVTGPLGLLHVRRDGSIALLAEASGANDLTLDADGTVYFTAGGVHRLTAAGKHDRLSTMMGTNGIELDPEGRYLYVTAGRNILRYDKPALDAPLGAAANFATNLGTPDGLAFDAQGRLWVAVHLDRAIAVFDTQSARELGRLPVPVVEPARIQNMAFGGDDGKVLYATAGNFDQNAVLLRYEVGVRGLPPQRGAAAYVAVRTLSERVNEQLLTSP